MKKIFESSQHSFIPFEEDTDKANKDARKRRTINTNLFYEDQSGKHQQTYCEFNFYTNQEKQILKEILNKAQLCRKRNIGYCFIFFKNIEGTTENVLKQ